MFPRHLPLLPLIATLAALAGCASDGGSDDDGGSGATPVSAAEGGTVVSADGVLTLVVPPGALAEDTVISLSRLEPDGLPPALAGVDVLAAYRAEPDGLQLAEPVAVGFDVGRAPVTAGLAAGRLPGVGSVASDAMAELELSSVGVAGEGPDDESILVVGRVEHFSDLVAVTVEVSWALDCMFCTTEGGAYGGTVSLPDAAWAAATREYQGTVAATTPVELLSGADIPETFIVDDPGSPRPEPPSHGFTYRCSAAGEGTVGVTLSVAPVVGPMATVAGAFGARAERLTATRAISCADDDPGLPTEPTFLRLEPDEGRPTEVVRAHFTGYTEPAQIEEVVVVIDRTPWGRPEPSITARAVSAEDPAEAYVDFIVPDALWDDIEAQRQEWPVYLQATWFPMGQSEPHTLFTRTSLAGHWRLRENVTSGPGCSPGGMSIDLILWDDNSWSSTIPASPGLYQAEGQWSLDPATGAIELGSCPSPHGEFVTFSGTFDEVEQSLFLEFEQDLHVGGAFGPFIVCDESWAPVPASCVIPECHPDRLMMRGCQSLNELGNLVSLSPTECHEGRATTCYDDAGSEQ